LAVIFGCEKCQPYLEHQEFELQCDNVALCWLLRTKDIDRQGRRILRLAPYKFRVTHTSGSENLVADALSRNYEGTSGDVPELNCATFCQSLPLLYSSLEQHQSENPYCRNLRDKLVANQGGWIRSR
jgi:hypothetical protein